MTTTPLSTAKPATPSDAGAHQDREAAAQRDAGQEHAEEASGSSQLSAGRQLSSVAGAFGDQPAQQESFFTSHLND